MTVSKLLVLRFSIFGTTSISVVKPRYNVLHVVVLVHSALRGSQEVSAEGRGSKSGGGGVN